MIRNLYIRHAVGSRLLLDCQQGELPFEIFSQDGKWKIIIRNVHKDTYELLASNQKELNIFVVNDGEKHSGKDWYYASGSPELIYSDKGEMITIIVDCKMSYEG